MHWHELEIEKQYILSDDFLYNLIQVPTIQELKWFSSNQLPLRNPYFSKFIYQDIITYIKDEVWIKSLTRVRHELYNNWNERYLLSLKHGSLLDMVEKETEINKQEFNSLIKTKQTHLLHLEKLRYLYPIWDTGCILEIDVFTQTLAGIHVGEIEFGNIHQMQDFIHPEYIAKDITHIGLFSEETISYFSSKNNIDYSKFIK